MVPVGCRSHRYSAQVPRTLPPIPTDAWVIHVDGSAVPNPGRMALGAVLQGPQGQLLQLSQDTRRTGCNNEAEILALLAALQTLQHQHIAPDTPVHVFTDSSILAEQLNLPHPKPVVRLGALYAQARQAWQQFPQGRLHWIPRHRNQQADALARAALQGAVQEIQNP